MPPWPSTSRISYVFAATGEEVRSSASPCNLGFCGSVGSFEVANSTVLSWLPNTSLTGPVPKNDTFSRTDGSPQTGQEPRAGSSVDQSWPFGQLNDVVMLPSLSSYA